MQKNGMPNIFSRKVNSLSHSLSLCCARSDNSPFSLSLLWFLFQKRWEKLLL
jgi:hypothetical protein